MSWFKDAADVCPVVEDEKLAMSDICMARNQKQSSRDVPETSMVWEVKDLSTSLIVKCRVIRSAQTKLRANFQVSQNSMKEESEGSAVAALNFRVILSHPFPCGSIHQSMPGSTQFMCREHRLGFMLLDSYSGLFLQHV